MGTDQRAQVWAKTDGHCWYCGKKMNPWDDFTVDHMDSRKQGGGDEVENLIPACKSCNSRKNSKCVEEYREYLQERKQHVFWGEQNQPVARPPIEEKPNPYLYKCRAFEECQYYASLVNRDLLHILVALITHGTDEDLFYESVWGMTSFDDLASATRYNKTILLSHLFFLQHQGLLQFTFTPSEHTIEYHLMMYKLEYEAHNFVRLL